MKQILTIVRSLGISLVMLASLGQNSSAQQLCSVQMATLTDPSNPNTYTLSAYLSGDSLCFGFNPQYTWTIYGNPNATLSGQQVSYTFTNPGYYMVCVQAMYQGMVSSHCDTIFVSGATDCTPTFNSTVQGLNASFNLSGNVPFTCFDGTTVYNWNFGDSTFATSTGNSGIDHTYSSSGTYNVCLTATTANGQVYTSCSVVTVVNGQGIFNLSGMVLAGGNCQQGPVLVELYGLGNNSYQSMTINGGPDSCFYYFQTPFSAQPAQYLIRATPMSGQFYMPTYFGDVLYWGDATLVTPLQNLWNLHINLIPNFTDTLPALGTVSGTVGGNGVTVTTTINGNTVSSQFNVEGSRIIILNSANQPVGFAFVNANGTFSFSNLPAGNYFLRLDNPKIPSSTIPFSISAGNNTASVNLTATGTGISEVTAAGKISRAESMELWPNPAGESISVHGTEGLITIVNSQGKVVMLSSQSKDINLSGLSSGIYQLIGKSASGKSLSARFIKK